MRCAVAAICLLWYGCTSDPAKEYPPKHSDTVGITVPEDAIPEHMKPKNADSADTDTVSR